MTTDEYIKLHGKTVLPAAGTPELQALNLNRRVLAANARLMRQQSGRSLYPFTRIDAGSGQGVRR